MLQLRTFGGLRVSASACDRGGGSLGRKPLALVALMARADGLTISRDRALGLLWPETDQDRARNALNQVVFLLRRRLGASAVTPTRYDIALDADSWVLDVTEFERAIAGGAFTQAVVSCQGSFLDGFYVPDAGEFERWVEQERSGLRRAYLNALERLALTARDRGDDRAAAEWWQHLARVEPLSPRIVIAAAHALAVTGEYAAALALTRSHEVRIRSELEAAVDPRIATLAKELRDHFRLGGRTDFVRRFPASGQPTTPGA